MSESSPESHTYVPHLDLVSPETIELYTKIKPSNQTLYDDLKVRDERLAMWLRDRAEQLAPELVDRNRQSRLALELVSMIIHQQAVDDLGNIFTLDVEEEVKTPPFPEQRRSTDILFEDGTA